MVLRPPGEAIPAARQLLHDVDLHPRRVCKIRAGAWRRDVEEEQARVIPHADGALGREIRPPVRRYGRDEAKARRVDHRSHIGSEHRSKGSESLKSAPIYAKARLQ